MTASADPSLRTVHSHELGDFTHLVLKTLSQGDLAVAAVMRSSFLAWWARTLLRIFYRHWTRPFVLEIDGTRAGFMVLRRSKQTLHIEALGVLPPFRRQGWGKWLLEQAAAQARGLGLTRLALHVSTGNRPALGLYADAGFYPVPRTWCSIQMEHILDAQGDR